MQILWQIETCRCLRSDYTKKKNKRGCLFKKEGRKNRQRAVKRLDEKSRPNPIFILFLVFLAWLRGGEGTEANEANPSGLFRISGKFKEFVRSIMQIQVICCKSFLSTYHLYTNRRFENISQNVSKSPLCLQYLQHGTSIHYSAD